MKFAFRLFLLTAFVRLVCTMDCAWQSFKESYDSADIIFVGKLVRVEYPVFSIFVDKVWKSRKTEHDPAVVEGTVRMANVLHPGEGCAEVWQQRQQTHGLNATYIIFGQYNPTEDFLYFSPFGKSGEIATPDGVISRRWNTCFLNAVQTNTWGKCDGCTEPDGNIFYGVVRHPDGCNTCSCHTEGATVCTHQKCWQTWEAVVMAAGLTALLVMAVAVVVRTYDKKDTAGGLLWFERKVF